MKNITTAAIVTILLISSFSIAAYAIDPVGTYTYKEKGYSGEMKVSRVNPSEAKWNITINTLHSSSLHMCDAEGVIENMVSDDKAVEAIYVADDETHGKFTVKFTKGGAVVDLADSTAFCGLNGYFGGAWAKDSSAKAKKAIKKNPRTAQ